MMQQQEPTPVANTQLHATEVDSSIQQDNEQHIITGDEQPSAVFYQSDSIVQQSEQSQKIIPVVATFQVPQTFKTEGIAENLRDFMEQEKTAALYCQQEERKVRSDMSLHENIIKGGIEIDDRLLQKEQKPIIESSSSEEENTLSINKPTIKPSKSSPSVSSTSSEDDVKGDSDDFPSSKKPVADAHIQETHVMELIHGVDADVEFQNDAIIPYSVPLLIQQPSTIPTNSQPQDATTHEKASPEQDNSKSKELEQEEEEDDDDDQEGEELDDAMMSSTSFVIEISPKGRFKRFGEELGRGAYKIVYKGVDNETGREIAWNVINLNRLPKQDRVRIKSEIDLIKKLEHKNIIHFISAWYNKEREQVVFITEMITGGSLRSYVKRIKTPRLKVIKGWCKEILQGLVYLHSQKPHPIIHRDLKCDNIFINSNSGDIRIGDLGLSTPMQNSFTTSVLGTPEFMAPELYEECYGTGVDIYAFGMCVLEMITLERPYKECQNPAQIYNKVIHGIRPQALDRIKDDEIKNFILWCLIRAETRPSAKDLLESKFLNETESEKNNHEVKITRSPSKDKKLGGSGAMTNDNAQGNRRVLQKQKSAILEEEEENSAGNSMKKEPIQEEQQQVDQLIVPPQLPIEIEESKELPLGNDVIIKIGSISLKEEADNDGHNTPSTKTLPNFKQPTPIAQSSESQDDQLLSPNEKKRKKKGFNKKLDESVIFLKKINDEKQKKMLSEKTMIGNAKKSDDDDQEEEEDDDLQAAPSTDNILNELKQQDLEEEKQSMLERQRLVQSIPKEPSKHAVSMNYDSNPGQQPALVRKDTTIIPISSIDAAQEKKFGLGKKFKEEPEQPFHRMGTANFGKNQKTGGMNSSSKKLQSAQSNDQNAVMGEPDDLRRTFTGITMPSHISSNPFLNSNQSLVKTLVSQSTGDKKDYAHQNSDNQLTTDQANPIQLLEKNRLGGSQFFDKVSKESPFDNQSSSSCNQSDHEHDSDIDRMTFPQSQEEGGPAKFQIQQSEGVKNSKVENRKSSVASNSKTLANLQHSYSVVVDQQKQHLTNGVTPIQKSSTQQIPNIQQAPKQQVVAPPAQSKTPTNDSKLIIQQPLTLRPSQPEAIQQSKLQVPQPIPAKAKVELATPTLKQSSSVVEAKPQEKKETKMVMSFKIADKEVFFDFDTAKDTPAGVAIEMVKELHLNESQIDVIQKHILSVIHKNQKNSLPAPEPKPQVLHSSSQVVGQQQQQSKPQSQATPQPKKQSTSKLSKDSAITMFNKLFSDIDSFYTQMKNLGIDTTEEIVEPIEVSIEEKAIRTNFLNNVLKAKREYKNSLMSLKQKIAQQQKSKQTQPTADEVLSLSMQQPQSLQKGSPQIATVPKAQEKQGAKQVEQSERISIPSVHEETKEKPLPTSQGTQQKTIYQVPQYIRKHFKAAPQQFSCQSRLSRNLTTTQSDVSPDEEIIQLQHMLNLLWYDSILLHSQKAQTKEEAQSIIQSHVSLRVDGWFGDKTEKCVMKFQKYKELPQNGIVNDHIWSMMQQHADQIIAEAKKQLSNESQTKSTTAPLSNMNQLGSSSKDLKPQSTQATSVQTVKTVKEKTNATPLSTTSNQQVKQTFAQSRPKEDPNLASPVKVVKVLPSNPSDLSQPDIDYKQFMEQHFFPKNSTSEWQQSVLGESDESKQGKIQYSTDEQN